MEFLKAISILVMVLIELAILWVSLSEKDDKQFRRRGIVFFIVFLIPLLYIIIK